ncbi:DUF5067 domain-containing protein [Bifidobacterium sp. ESL0784]|uniref:DUF5067 domain-containing protein n=1 Tax=Bifidobacterium sp. ESL0784 TaxID=2983231 RepID=UPI0023F9B8E4|nr:DUF5067 domain-containing protein [Bifidobacterium sp. ESL0784]MDF7640824.1 DUF5067 domain-containing protein [Bifidobacterium sp. ESL0784]
MQENDNPYNDNPYNDGVVSQPNVQYGGQAASQPPMGQMPQQPVDPTFQPPFNQMPQQQQVGQMPQQPVGPTSQPPMGMALQPPMGMEPEHPFGPGAKRPGMAIVALVLGIVAIILFWIPIVGIGCGVAAIVTGIISMRKINAERLRGKGMSIGGLVTGIIAAVLSVIVFIGSFSTTMERLNGNTGDSSDSSAIYAPPQGDKDEKKEERDYKNPKLKILKGSGSLKGADVKIASAKREPKNTEGHATLIITYEYKNTSDKKLSFLRAVDYSVSQNGMSLSEDYLPNRDGRYKGYDGESLYTDVAPNDSLKVTVAYELVDGSTPVDVALESGTDLDDTTYITQRINLK